MSLQAGEKLGPYEILSPLGAGGMGEVYLANEGKLDRKFAIDVLPETTSRDKERVVRFERKAKLLASLNHPSIAATIVPFGELIDSETTYGVGSRC